MSGSAQGPGNALVVEGKNAFVEFSRNQRGITNQVTAEAWIKTTSLSNQHFVVKYDRDSENGFQLHTLNGKAGFSGRDGSGQYRVSGYSDVFVADGKWHHLAGVCTGPDWLIYVDGVLQGKLETHYPDTDLRSNEPLLVGGYFYSTNTWFYNGTIDEVRVWKRALTADEIRKNMCRSVPANSPDLVAYYKMDASSGSTVQDLSSYKMNGSFRNMNAATAWVTSGAAIGDNSVYLYPTGNWQGQKLEYEGTNGSKFWVDSVGTNSRTAGVHIYYVGARPNSITGISSSEPVTEYYGVFTALYAADKYNINYSTRNELCRAEAFSRVNNSILSWNKIATTVEGGTAHARTDGASKEFVVHGTTKGKLNINGPKSICMGSSIELIADTDLIPVWSTGHEGKSLTITAPGEYWATAYSETCALTDTFTIEELPLPIIELSDEIKICAGGQATITAPAGFATYLWSNGSQASSIQVAAPGTYWVEVTNTSGCSSRASVQVSTVPIPTIPLQDNQSYFVCTGETAIIDATTEGATYKWSDGSTNPTFMTGTQGAYWVDIQVAGCTYRRTILLVVSSLPGSLAITGTPQFCTGSSTRLSVNTTAAVRWSTGQTTQSIEVTQPGKYWVSVNAASCSLSDTVMVEEMDLPNVNLGEDLKLCPGATATIQAPAGYAGYRWSTGSFANGITVEAPGTYWVDVTNTNGCISRSTIEVKPSDDPAISLEDNQTYTTCYGKPISINASTPEATYLWSDGSTAPILTAIDSGEYWVDITVEGCVYRRNVQVLPEDCPLIPNIITPNGDGRNDEFSIQGIEMNNVRVEIYSRWGKLIFKTDNYKNSWSPTDVAAGIYYYYIKSGSSSKEFKGWLEIVR